MRRLGILASALFILIGCAWAVASPVGSSPDDDFHLTSIWCAWGEREGLCEIESVDPLVVEVPAALVDSSECFKFRPGVGGACTEHLARTDASGVTRVNDGLYPGLYYAVAGVFAGSDIRTGVVMIRVMNVLLAGLLMLGVLLSATPLLRRGYVLAFSVVTVPLGLFVIASTNPSSWTQSGGAAFWAFLFLWLSGDHRTPRRRRAIVLPGLLLSGLMLIGSRVDGALLALFETLAVVVLSWPAVRALQLSRSAAFWRVLPGLAVCVLAVITVLSTTQLSAHAGGMADSPPGEANRPFVPLLVNNVLELPSLILGSVGGGRLGWLDTDMPSTVLFVGSLALGALVLVGLTDMWARKGIALLILAIPLVVLPVFVLQRGGNIVGEGVQARYLLPALVAFMGILLLVRAPELPWLIGRLQGAVFVSALTLSGVVAFQANLARYASDRAPVAEGGAASSWSMLPFVDGSLLLALVTVASVGYFWCAAAIAARQSHGPLESLAVDNPSSRD